MNETEKLIAHNQLKLLSQILYLEAEKWRNRDYNKGAACLENLARDCSNISERILMQGEL